MAASPIAAPSPSEPPVKGGQLKRPSDVVLSSSSSSKRIRSTTSSASTNPLQIKPLGNLLFNPEHEATRTNGLGSLARLPDELLLSNLFSLLDGEDLIRMSGVSKALYAWGHVEGIWKAVFISRSQGKLLSWYGSWRSTYIVHFLRGGSVPSSPPTPIPTPTLYSDVLFQPSLCAAFDPRPLFLSSSFKPSISRLDGRGLTPSDLPEGPIILTHLMEHWRAMKPSHQWTLPNLATRFPDVPLRAEATLALLPDYLTYHDNCPLDESPLYLFESLFVEKTKECEDGGLGADYEVPECFKEDMYEVMGSERPDYRWLIVGPTRSGSTWHQDPNGTSAWNAVTVGSKAWIMFPPDVTPPGVYVSEDQGEVEAPLSLAEWFMSYYAGAKAKYGPLAKDPTTRGKMREGICNAGEIFFVPSGWWHIVINLTPAVAVTQNFVSQRELPAVLKFMKERPEQVSGFKLKRDEHNNDGGLDDCDEIVSGVFDAFCEALKRDKREVFETAMEAQGGLKARVADAEVEEVEGKSVPLWETVKKTDGASGFSFGFGGDGDFEEDEAELE